MNAASLRREILIVLERAEPYALPAETLRTEVTSRVRPEPNDEAWEDAIGWLESKKFIEKMADHFDETKSKWLITEAGKTLLRK